MIAVCIATYNQEAYIAQAIESVQAQQCDEPIRIYIGDDASTDGTAILCERLAAEDRRIVYIRRPQNMGLTDNTLDLYERIMADGCEYIAMLDGDDYWTDDHKLQKQTDFLRAHSETGFVHTNAFEQTDGERIANDMTPKPTGDIHDCYDLRGARQTNCTVFFRTGLLKQEELEAIRNQHFVVLDYPLYGLFAQRTRFGFIDHYTAAWRKHVSVSQATSFKAYWKYRKERIRMWRWLDAQYPNTFHYRSITATKWLFLQFIGYFLQKISLLFA